MDKPELSGEELLCLQLPEEWQTDEAWNELGRLTNEFRVFTQYIQDGDLGNCLVIRKFANDNEREDMYDYWMSEIKEQTDD